MGKIFKKIRHFLYPHESNNYRAKLLHLDSLLILISFFVVGAFIFTGIKNVFPSVLGISTGMTANDLLALTNEKRIENGLAPLSLNSQLSAAAENKASDMFAKNYWAHNSPDGTVPWSFIRGAGYNYVYAGENLARGFDNSQEVINAWMASPDHRQNMLSSNYKEIGFAIKTGNLTGEETILVVEMFGTGTVAVAEKTTSPKGAITEQQTSIATVPSITLNQKLEMAVLPETEIQKNQGIESRPLFNSRSLSKNVVLIIIYLLILALIIDVIVIEKRKVIRFVGHNLDHLLFLIFVLSLIFLFTKGFIV